MQPSPVPYVYTTHHQKAIDVDKKVLQYNIYIRLLVTSEWNWFYLVSCKNPWKKGVDALLSVSDLILIPNYLRSVM